MQVEAVPQRDHGGIRFGLTSSRERDPARAVRELEAALGSEAALYLVFAAVPYHLDALASELSARWGDRVIGATCARFFGPAGATGATVMAVALSGDLTAETMTIGALDELTGSLERIEPQLRRFRQRATAADDGTEAFALLLVDGLRMQEEHLAVSLTTGLAGIPLVGGSASDDMRFEYTAVLSGGRFVDNTATCTVVRLARGSFVPFHLQHYEPRDEVLVITEATPELRLVHQINGIPAAEAYAEALGLPAEALTADVIAANPVVLRAGGVAWVRAVSQVLPDGTLKFLAAIDTGAILRLARPTDPMQALSEGFAAMRRQIGELQGVLAFDCVLRHAEFQRTGLSAQVATELDRNHVAGFSTYGEQFDGIHVNQTMVGVAFGTGPDR